MTLQFGSSRASVRPPTLSHYFSAVCLYVGISSSLAASFQPNILHLMADDMRPQLGAYGQSAMITPYIDALALNRLFLIQVTRSLRTAPRVVTHS
jgi:hypothetical protein